jgi:hypothetical protein
MPTINQLPTVTQVSGGDQFPLYVTSQGDARRCSVTTMLAYFQDNFSDIVASSIRTVPITFAQLPNATVAGAGTRAFIADADTATFGATVAGGGANIVPVYSDGTDWKVG